MPQIPSTTTTSAKLKHAKLCYQFIINHILVILTTLVVVPLIALQQNPHQILQTWNYSLHLDLFISLAAAFAATAYLMSKPRRIFLVDYSCYKPPSACRVPFSAFMLHSRLILKDSPKSVDFQMRILERSGLGEETCLPPAIHHLPPATTMAAARAEAEAVIFSAIDSLMTKTGVKPNEIDFLIVNCSLFSPTPSLSAMVVNKYNLRSNIRSFNLSGMGCSAGLISIDLARDLLQAHPNSNALVVSTEIITPNYYKVILFIPKP